jgi:DNA modification methylase
MPKIGDSGALKPYWASKDRYTARYYQGNTLSVARRLLSRSVQCIVTSPPYWGLRDYGTGEWTGGDENCDHEGSRIDSRRTPTEANVGQDGNFARLLKRAAGDNSVQGTTCLKCGAKRIDQQLGSEPSPDCLTQGKAQCGGCFVCSMVGVFRELRRVLRDDGTLFLNLGDSYGSDQLPSGNLVGIPWRVALALQADGWILRQDIIWHKPAPMPESVRNRCTKAHEYVFLFAKKQGYYYDNEAIKVESEDERTDPEEASAKYQILGNSGNQGNGRGIIRPKLSNKRSVWSIPSSGFPGAHFATYPPRLIEPMITPARAARLD